MVREGSLAFFIIVQNVHITQVQSCENAKKARPAGRAFKFIDKYGPLGAYSAVPPDMS